MAKVKAMLFTLGFFILASILLSFGLLMLENTRNSETRFIELSSLDRIYELDLSIQRSLKKIFDIESGIDLNINNLDVSFEEDLPSNNVDNFKNETDYLKSFVENNSFAILNIDDLKENLTLIIRPYNINYTHNNFGGNKIMVIPEKLNFNGYRVDITTTESISSGSCRGSGSAKDVYLNVYVTGSGGSCSDLNHKKVEIYNNGGDLLVLLELTPLGLYDIQLIIIDYFDLHVKTTVNSLDDINEQIIITTPDIIEINFEELGIYKKSYARLL